MIVRLDRFKYTPDATYGVLYVESGPIEIFRCVTLELPWMNNAKNASCIPTGAYPMQYEYSHRFDRYCWELYEVENRSEIKIHPANYVSQLHGCIALGKEITRINNDTINDVSHSKLSVARFENALQHEIAKTVYIVIDDCTDAHELRDDDLDIRI